MRREQALPDRRITTDGFGKFTRGKWLCIRVIAVSLHYAAPGTDKSATIKYAVRGEGDENEPARQPGRFDEPRSLCGRPPRREHLLLRPSRRGGPSRARPRRVRPVLPVADPVPPLVRPLRRHERSVRRGPGRSPCPR